MDEPRKSESALGPYRVLDLTNEKGLLCTKILADLGADVIKIEKPGGDPTRNIGPFYHDIPDPEKSLYWFTFNTSKRSITLDIEKADGQEIFKRLAKDADFVVECFPPGYMEELGLGYSVLSDINPRIILTSITPFGQTGPYKDYKASDIVGVAMGGLMYLVGDPDRPPVRASLSLGYAETGVQAAVGTMIAHWHRGMTGEGQCVDVSMQECVHFTTDWARPTYYLENYIMERLGPFAPYREGTVRIIYHCKNGHVALMGTSGPEMEVYMDWMESEGMVSNLRDMELGGLGGVALTGLSQEGIWHVEEVFANFFMTHTKQELYEEAIKRGLIVMPVSTTADLLANVQLAARDYFVKVDHPELGDTLTYAGAPFKLSETPWRIWNQPPLIGEHNEEIYEKELGLSKEELIVLKEANVI